MTNDRVLGHAEPDLAVNPRNALNLVGACQFILAPKLRVPGAFASFDGGRSWRDDGALPLPRGFEQGADTTVAFDSHGTAFIAALMAHGGGGYASRVTRGGVFLWRSHDAGRTFSKPQAVYVGRGFQDHPWLVVGGDHLFLAWTNDAGLEFASSADDGRTFSRPRLLVHGTAPADPVLTISGTTLRVFFQEFVSSEIRIETVSSTDDGVRFGTPQLIASVNAPPLTGGPKGGAIPPPLIGAAAGPDPYLAAVAISAQNASAGHPVVEAWESGVGGWSGPFLPASGASTSLSQQQPRLLFAGRHLFVLFFTESRRGRVDTQLASAPLGSDHFDERRLTNSPFAAPGWMGDYQALAATSRAGYAVWNDTHTGRLEIVARRIGLP